MRSPNYPTMTLDKAIELTQKFFDKYTRSSVPADLAISALGYSSKSSTSKQYLATLIYFGLMDATGQKNERKVKISELGFKILKNPIPNEKALALRQAALKPAIFYKIWKAYPDSLPESSLLSWELASNYHFNPRTISDFISVFERTMKFAKVYELGKLDDVAEPEINDEAAIENPPNEGNTGSQIPPASTVNMHQRFAGQNTQESEIAKYPVGKGITIRLLANGPISQKAVMKLVKLLEINMDDFPADTETAE